MTYVQALSSGQLRSIMPHVPDPKSESFEQHLADAKVARVVKRSKSEKMLSFILSRVKFFFYHIINHS
jgi:hypothetical protein